MDTQPSSIGPEGSGEIIDREVDRQARVQACLASVTVWFGVCGMMMSALVGTEQFLLPVLSMGVLTPLILVLCSLGIICAVGGSLSTLRLVLLRSRLRHA